MRVAGFKEKLILDLTIYALSGLKLMVIPCATSRVLGLQMCIATLSFMGLSCVPHAPLPWSLSLD